MNPTQEKAAAPSKETAARINQNSQHDTDSSGRLQRENKPTTLGFSLFRDPLYQAFGIADIRQRLELKFVACTALGGLNGYPIDPDRIKNPYLRTMGSAGRLLKNWSVRDLSEIHGLPALAAEQALLATMENPIWGEDDVILIGLLERIENLQLKAEMSGRTL